jgi:ABC-2 type transport system ATP-binding protein
MNDVAIRVENLVKVYRHRGGETRAVDDLTFAVQRGSIFGLLGPNGAGKTTALRILTTLARPTRGRAAVLGYDVVEAPLEVRRRIGVVIQEQAADLLLSVRDNLLTFARFHGRAAAAARRDADELMARFALDAVADRKVQDLSGGSRRRVQVAKMFMIDVPVLFLDEFSAGMDPLLKRRVMELLRTQAREGRTIVLTTQILTEAEELCDDILIIHRGRLIARGSVAALKLLADRVYDVTVSFTRPPDDLYRIVGGYQTLDLLVDQNTVRLKLKEDEARVLELLASLSRHGQVQRLEISSGSLEDVFVELTQNAEKAS